LKKLYKKARNNTNTLLRKKRVT